MILNSFIVCDLIRQENTRKHILIGVYSDSIILQPAPEKTDIICLPLSFFIRFLLNNEKENIPEAFKLVVSFDVEKAPAYEFKNDLKKDTKNVTIILSISPLLIPIATKTMGFKIHFSYADGKTIEFDLGTIKISLIEQIVVQKQEKKEAVLEK